MHLLFLAGAADALACLGCIHVRIYLNLSPWPRYSAGYLLIRKSLDLLNTLVVRGRR
jgi:hypothetical protein